ncbi:hypothetical protein J5N97_011465 [Dioscorea zingiberensis]|uniref:Uncharacterized protein n=1 Tax=Dioscorea zingiberensis TaxID=325984 RepID=A0A9D5D0F5_9LILI|nr:hypothetical protein J5N97_011465 [Dioscorea zingiberensis]
MTHLRLRVFGSFLRHLRDCMSPCSSNSDTLQYHRLDTCFQASCVNIMEDEPEVATSVTPVCPEINMDSDVVTLKNKYMGVMEEPKGLQLKGLNLMDKILVVRGLPIVFSIWDVGGEPRYINHVPVACKDAAAILIMFDLTRRCTLNKQTAVLILIGTKFDDFVQLPVDMQLTIVNEARTYACTMKATLFFSSATHNINVYKIFKFITAKLFNLPWHVKRNLTIGEPIIDF